jgi:hypothetical protein
MSTDPGNRQSSLIDIFKAVGAIVALPLALFALANSIVAQPVIALVVALITAILASAWVVWSDWTGIMEVIVAWLALLVVVLAGFVVWPSTMTVEGTILDTAGDPVSREKVVLIDVYGVSRETRTDAEGNYQFKRVPSGRYTVRAKGSEVGGAGGILVRVMRTDLRVSQPTPTLEPTEEPTPISTGRLEITHPLEMIVEEDDVVTVEIMADPRFAEIGVHPAHATGVISIETSGGRARIEDRIRLYPVMSAELIAGNFDVIQGDADPRRGITTTYHAVWTWSITARRPGRQQKITINIFGEATIDGEKRSVLEMSKSRNINVVEKPWPKRILDGLANNLVTILGTGGPLALLIAYLKYRADRANRQLEDKIASLENKLKELGGKEATEGDGKTDA